MKHTTQYLYGQDPRRYSHLQEPLANMKIQDAHDLVMTLGEHLNCLDPSEEQAKLRERLLAAQKAKLHWERILNELKEDNE